VTRTSEALPEVQEGGTLQPGFGAIGELCKTSIRWRRKIRSQASTLPTQRSARKGVELGKSPEAVGFSQTGEVAGEGFEGPWLRMQR
jgi:hypothetical protein